MRVKLWDIDTNQTVKLVEEKLQFWKLRVKELGHIIYFYDFLECLEGLLLISEYKKQKTCNKVHPLTVLNFWVKKCVCLQNVCKRNWVYLLHFCERPLHIHVYNFLDIRNEWTIQQHLIFKCFIVLCLRFLYRQNDLKKKPYKLKNAFPYLKPLLF